MYMLLSSMYITWEPTVKTRATSDDTVSVTLSRVCIPRETRGSRKRRLSVMRSK